MAIETSMSLLAAGRAGMTPGLARPSFSRLDKKRTICRIGKKRQDRSIQPTSRWECGHGEQGGLERPKRWPRGLILRLPPRGYLPPVGIQSGLERELQAWPLALHEPGQSISNDIVNSGQVIERSLAGCSWSTPISACEHTTHNSRY